MSLWKIAWRSIQQRGLASALTALSMALGVMLVVLVLSIHGVVALSFKNNSSLGYNLIVGAKGGKLQLTLNTVYYLSQPVENIPYDYYLEFTRAEKRTTFLQHSIRSSGHNSEWDSIETPLAPRSAAGFCGLTSAAAAARRRAPASDRPRCGARRAGSVRQNGTQPRAPAGRTAGRAGAAPAADGAAAEIPS